MRRGKKRKFGASGEEEEEKKIVWFVNVSRLASCISYPTISNVQFLEYHYLFLFLLLFSSFSSLYSSSSLHN